MLSCPSCIQASLSQNYTWISSQLSSCISWWHWLIKKNPRSSIGLEIRPQSAFSAFRALLPSANYCAEWFGGVWQPSADSNGLLGHITVSRWLSHPTLKVRIQTKRSQTAITICRGLSHPTGWAALPSDFFQGWSFSDDINSRLFLMNKKGLTSLVHWNDSLSI